MIDTSLKACCGCGACANVCPKKAIEMKENCEGFLYPVIDKKSCIDCDKCSKVCPFFGERLNTKEPLGAIGFKHYSDEVRLKSTSGGLFTAISDYVLDSGGTVYGAIYDENFDVVHVRGETRIQRNEMCGSKYVQSDIVDVFLQIKEDLAHNKLVLFTGTPCQAASIRRFFGDNPQLLTCDLICHGVPSPRIWREFRKYIEDQSDSKIEKIYIRETENCWGEHITRIVLKNGSVIKTKKYLDLFFTNNSLRYSCYNCPFTTLNRDSDFTFADFWGVEKKYPEVRDEKGVSFGLINTLKAEKIFEKIRDKGICFNASFSDSVQPQLSHPCKRPTVRKRFWKDYSKKGIDFVTEKYVGKKYGVRLKICITRILKKILPK